MNFCLYSAVQHENKERAEDNEVKRHEKEQKKAILNE